MSIIKHQFQTPKKNIVSIIKHQCIINEFLFLFEFLNHNFRTTLTNRNLVFLDGGGV